MTSKLLSKVSAALLETLQKESIGRAQLSRLSGVNIASLNRILKGSTTSSNYISLAALERLAEIFGSSVSVVFDRPLDGKLFHKSAAKLLPGLRAKRPHGAVKKTQPAKKAKKVKVTKKAKQAESNSDSNYTS